MTDYKAGFAERFGEANAQAVLDAAYAHSDQGWMIDSDDRGSNEFQWALLVCIGSECLTRYRGHHGITAGEDEIKQWVYLCADLGQYDGPPPDYLALMCGAYEGWVNTDAMSVTFDEEASDA